MPSAVIKRIREKEGGLEGYSDYEIAKTLQRKFQEDTGQQVPFDEVARELGLQMSHRELAIPSRTLEEGNIDLYNRPQVKNADGSISTVRSMSFNEDGQEILIPTIADDGTVMSPDQAIATYRQTGKHLGKFKNAQAANDYAEALHQQQQDFYLRSPYPHPAGIPANPSEYQHGPKPTPRQIILQQIADRKTEEFLRQGSPTPAAGHRAGPMVGPAPEDTLFKALVEKTFGPRGEVTPKQQARSVIAFEARRQGLTPKQYREQVGARIGPLERASKDFAAGMAGSAEGFLGYMTRFTGKQGGTQDLAARLNEFGGRMTPSNPNFLDQVAQGFGSTVAFYAPGLGIARGAQAVYQIAPRIALWLGSGASAGLEAAAEAGQVYDQLIAEGKSQAEAKRAADIAFWENQILVGYTNKLGLFGEKGGQLMRRSLSAITEGGQEYVQQIIQNQATNRPLTEGGFEAAAVGAIVGGGLGGSAQTPQEAAGAAWNRDIERVGSQPELARQQALEAMEPERAQMTAERIGAPLDTTTIRIPAKEGETDADRQRSAAQLHEAVPAPPGEGAQEVPAAERPSRVPRGRQAEGQAQEEETPPPLIPETRDFTPRTEGDRLEEMLAQISSANPPAWVRQDRRQTAERRGRPRTLKPERRTMNLRELVLDRLQREAGLAGEHIEDGEVQPATPEVVTEAVQTSAREEKTTPTQARKELVAQIDKALETAKFEREYKSTAETPFVTFEVPGDGTFKVLATQERLKAFQKKVKTWSGFTERSKRPAKPGGSYAPTIRAMLEDENNRDEQLNAWELSKSIGKPLRFGLKNDLTPIPFTDAEDITIAGHKLFVGRYRGGEWRVADPESGYAVSQLATTKAKAIEAARAAFKNTPKEKIEAAFAGVKKYGQATLEQMFLDHNRYTPQEDVTPETTEAKPKKKATKIRPTKKTKGIPFEQAEQEAEQAGYDNPDGDVAAIAQPIYEKAHKGKHDSIEDLYEKIHEGQYRATRDYGLKIGVREDQINRQLARAAFNNTSHSPERAGDRWIQDYVVHMVEVYKAARAQASEETRDAVKVAFENYRRTYVTKLEAYFHAHSRVASAFIVGPAKFPTQRNEKRMATADKRLSELTVYDERGKKRLAKIARGVPEKVTPQTEAEEVRGRLEVRKKLQLAYKAANAVVRSKESVEVKRAKLTGFGNFTGKEIEEMLNGDFAGRRGVPDYKMANNRAEIKRLEGRLKALEGKIGAAAGGNRRIDFDGGHVVVNYDADRIQVFHDTKPEENVRRTLKSRGFNWSPREGAWQRKITENAFRVTGEILGLTQPQLKGTTEAEQRPPAASIGPEAITFKPGENYRSDIRVPFDPARVERRKPIRREEIMVPFLKALNIPVTHGRIKTPGVGGYFYPFTRTVRIKRLNDIQTTAHEIAHYIDDVLWRKKGKHGWTRRGAQPWLRGNHEKAAIFSKELKGVSYDTTKVYEGFAEFVRHWMTDPSYALERAPEFTRYWEEELLPSIDKKWAKAIWKAREGMSAWFEQASLDRLRSVYGGGDVASLYRDVMDTGLDRLRQAILDDLHGLRKFETTVMGMEQPLKMGPYETARLARAAYSISEGVLKYGPLKILGTRWDYMSRDGEPSTIVDEKGRVRTNPAWKSWGLRDILKPVADDLELWKLYATARSADELRKQGRENLVEPDMIRAGLELGKRFPIFEEVFQDYQKWNRRVLDFAEQTGILSSKQREKFRRELYLPFYRVSQKGITKRQGGTEGAIAPFKALRGGRSNLNDVVDNMIKNMTMIVTEGIRNHARLEILRMAGRENAGKFMQKIPRDSKKISLNKDQVKEGLLRALGLDPKRYMMARRLGGGDPAIEAVLEGMSATAEDFVDVWTHWEAPKGENVVAVRENGELQFYEIIDPLLYRSFASINRKGMGQRNWFMRSLNATRRLMQATVTLTLDFATANMWRDAVQSMVFSQHGFVPFWDTAAGMWSRISRNANYRSFIANGGGMSSYMVEPAAFQDHVERMYQKHPLSIKWVLHTPARVLLGLELLADAAEMSTRLGEYRNALGRGESPRHAAYVAREITTDFSMRGDSEAMNALYNSVIFLKAGMNGLDRYYRGIAKNSNRQAIRIRSAMVAMLSVWLYNLNRGNPCYDTLEDWDKDGNWHVLVPTGETGDCEQRYVHLRFPKPWETGAIASAAERSWETYLNKVETGYANGKEYAQHIQEIAIQLFRQDWIAGMVEPIYETYVINETRFTKRKVVPDSQMDLMPFAQVDPYGSKLLADLALKTAELPPELQFSPRRAEALIRGYFNTWGMYGLMIADRVAYHSELPSMQAAEWPVLRRFMEREPTRHTADERRFWEFAKTADSIAKTGKAVMPTAPEVSEHYLTMEQGHYTKLVERIRRKVRGINDAMLAIYMNPDLTPDQKAAKRDELQRQKNLIFEEAAEEITQFERNQSRQ